MPRDASPEDSRVTTGIRRRRWLLPAVLVLIWLAVGGPLGSFQGQLAGVAENDNAAFLPTIAESTKVNEPHTALRRCSHHPRDHRVRARVRHHL